MTTTTLERARHAKTPSFNDQPPPAPKKPEKGELLIQIPQINVQQIMLRVIGDSPLLCHAWSAKAEKQILDKQMQKAKSARGAKDPEQDFKDSLYPMPDGTGYGFPCSAFKLAAVAACRYVDGLKMTEATGMFFVNGKLTPIEGTPTMQQDNVIIGRGTADIRFRGVFEQWATTLTISYNAAVVSPEQLVGLFNLAGFSVGVGEWRPGKKGSYGRFHVG